MGPLFDENISNSTYPADTVYLTGVAGSADVGKPVILAGATTFALAEDGDDFEGFIYAVDPVFADGTVTGSIQRQPLLRKRVINAGATQLAIGDTVVAAAQVTAGTKGKPQVKAGAGSWRVIELLNGTGLQTEELVIEKV